MIVFCDALHEKQETGMQRLNRLLFDYILRNRIEFR